MTAICSPFSELSKKNFLRYILPFGVLLIKRTINGIIKNVKQPDKMKTNPSNILSTRFNEINSNQIELKGMVSFTEKEQTILDESFSKSLFYIQLISLILAVLSYLIIHL